MPAKLTAPLRRIVRIQGDSGEVFDFDVTLSGWGLRIKRAGVRKHLHAEIPWTRIFKHATDSKKGYVLGSIEAAAAHLEADPFKGL